MTAEATVAEFLTELYEKHAVNPEAKLGFQVNALDFDGQVYQRFGIKNYSSVTLRVEMTIRDFVLLYKDTDDPWYLVVSNRALEQQLPVVSL